MIVQTGLDVLMESNYQALAGRRVALMTNPSGVDRNLRSTYDILWRADAVNLVALFSPEHGLSASAPDAEHVGSMVDKRTGLPIYSLYGETYHPTAEMLADIDVIVCDVQDIGVRFYTYVWTVTNIMEAAGRYNVEVIILDRPNPLGGVEVFGPPVDEGFRSFVGQFAVPIQHGMTIGELALMVNGLWNPTAATVNVIQYAGWQRHMTWSDTGLLWVPPSPAMPHLAALQQYPGACLIEGTMLSEGRGTALPFEVFGAPFINANQLADHLNSLQWEGVRFRPHRFIPTDSKWKMTLCEGVQVHMIDKMNWRPIDVWCGIIRELKVCYPDDFQWLPPQSHGVEAGEVYHFDRLIGSDKVRLQIDKGVSLDEITAGWDDFGHVFRQLREPYLLYE